MACSLPHIDSEVEALVSSSLAVTSSGLSSDVSDAGLPSEKIMASGKNGDDGDLLLFRDCPMLVILVIGFPERLASQVFLEWNVLWWLPIPGSCQITHADVQPVTSVPDQNEIVFA
ncbi:hypothetical protein Tco_0705288 [Tanacetum coccineum]|uniref:Uncharacterized protein n=1 Tax=Tanacetum coccineum TaxID=301880 RepID=A0ABQ4Y674_9ASTR